MGNKSSRVSRKVRGGDEDEESLLRVSDCFLEIKAKACRSGQSANPGVSLELMINRSVSLIKHLNRQSTELRLVSWRGVRNDEFLSRLKQEFLQLSIDANNFLDALLTNLESSNDELRKFLDAMLDWTPSRDRQEKMLEKLKQFQSRESFSKQFLQSFHDLMEQHQGIVKMVQQQGTSKEKEFKTLKWLRKVIYTTFAGFFVAVLICTILAAALHASPVLASVVAAASTAASWGPLALLVDELWVKKLNELRLAEKELCTLWRGAEVDKERVPCEVEPIFLLVNELEQALDSVRSNEEFRSMKERLLEELLGAIHGVNDAIAKVEDCKNELDGSRDELIKSIMEESNGVQRGQSKLLLGS